MSKIIYYVTVLMLMVSALPIFSFAQSATASLSGTVTDEKGGVVPGVNITITNPATNFKKTTVTDENGKFFVSQLPPSSYNLIAENKGFTSEFKNVELNVGDQRTINIE